MIFLPSEQHKQKMAKRKSTQTQSHDKPKRGRKSTKQINDDSSDEVSAAIKKFQQQKIRRKLEH